MLRQLNASTPLQTDAETVLRPFKRLRLPTMWLRSWMRLPQRLNCNAERTFLAMPGATDNCSAVEVTYEDVETSMGCSGAMNFIRTYTATDACGNSVSASQEVTFNDLIAPTFTTPMDVTVECDTDLMDPSSTGDVMDAADVCSADILVTFTDELSTSEGSCLADNVVTRTWTVSRWLRKRFD